MFDAPPNPGAIRAGSGANVFASACGEGPPSGIPPGTAGPSGCELGECGRAPTAGGGPSTNIVRACAPAVGARLPCPYPPGGGCDALCGRGAWYGAGCGACTGGAAIGGLIGGELGEFEREAFCAAACARSRSSSSFAPYPITVFASAGCAAGAGGCFAPQNTQCSAASGRSLVQLAHFFTVPLRRELDSDLRNIGPRASALQT